MNIIIDGDVMGQGRLWAESLMSVDAYLRLQFWAGVFVFAACIPQLHIARKFRFPIESGRMTIFGYWLGIQLRSGRAAIILGDLGTVLDFIAAIVGRVGIAMQAIVALFAVDDVLSEPLTPRPMITLMLIAVAMIQVRSLTAYSPRLPTSLP